MEITATLTVAVVTDSSEYLMEKKMLSRLVSRRENKVIHARGMEWDAPKDWYVVEKNIKVFNAFVRNLGRLDITAPMKLAALMSSTAYRIKETIRQDSVGSRERKASCARGTRIARMNNVF